MSKTYFSRLNYTLANEDTSLEIAIASEIKPGRTLAVCGSGGRSLPLLPFTESLECVDLAGEQLALARHRLATVSLLSWKEFLLYWGFAPFEASENRGVRKEMFEMLPLDQPDREYFAKVFESVEYAALLYQGKWEKTFTSVPKLLRRVVGNRYDAVFSFTKMEDQRAYFDRELENRRWLLVPRLVLRAFGNAAFFNAFLYKGHFIKKNVSESHFEYYRQTFRRLFYQGLTRENFFLQLLFLGKVQYSEGNPVEAHQAVFGKIKAAVASKKVGFHQTDLIQFAENSQDKFDFVSLSDVPSYFDKEQDQVYLQRLSKGLNPGAIVVVRCYLRVPENTDLSGFIDVTDRFKTAIDAEKTQMYRTFIYQYQGPK